MELETLSSKIYDSTFIPKIKIKPSFFMPEDSSLSYSSLIHSIEQFLEHLLPDEIKTDLSRLQSALPMIVSTPFSRHSRGIAITTLCSSEYANGTGRFISDMISRWLIPGKILELGATRTFAFYFEGDSNEYLFNERVVITNSREDYIMIHQNFPAIAKEIKLTLLAVYHARHLMSVKTLTHQEKIALIQENISSLIDRPSKDFDLSIHDHMHQFFIKLNAEEKIKQINEQITPFFKFRTKSFDRDIFTEIQHFVLLFREKFTALRSVRYISRLICYQHLFRKSLQLAIKTNPSERHIRLKVLHAKTSHPTLGILVGISLLRENELFKKKHLKESIQSCVAQCSEVSDSFVVDWRNDKIPTFYIEIEKNDRKPFSIQEVKRLRQKLPQELRERIENVSHRVFISRNEEEVLRHIVTLSQELRYVKDLPQVVIHFHNQTHQDLTFNLIFLRLLKISPSNIKEILPPHFIIEEIKIVGHLRNKYPKEASVIKVTLPKAPFFRKDYSVDLHKARQAVVNELTKIFGEFRDYNGGMISKQTETLNELRSLLAADKIQNDFLMENFFYAIEPPTMQSVLSPILLKTAFLLLLEAETINPDFQQIPPFYKTKSTHSTFITLIKALNLSLKQELLTHLPSLNISPYNLAYSTLTIQAHSYLILFYHTSDAQELNLFATAIEQFLSKRIAKE